MEPLQKDEIYWRRLAILDVAHTHNISCCDTPLTAANGFFFSHQFMKSHLFVMTSSKGNIVSVTGPLWGEFTVTGEFPSQGPVAQRFDVFVDLHLNKRLTKQSWRWWFETPSCSPWCHCNVFPFKSYIWHIWIVITKISVIFQLPRDMTKSFSCMFSNRSAIDFHCLFVARDMCNNALLFQNTSPLKR